MEKLIELLNEYSKNIGYFNKEDLQGQTKAWILSKEFGFIKRLVENNKIDFSREGNLSNELVDLFGRKLDTVEGVIALLSIQDKPIDFLISILK